MQALQQVRHEKYHTHISLLLESFITLQHWVKVDLPFFFKYSFSFIDSTAEDMTGNGMREGERHAAKGAQAGTRTAGRRSYNKASAHETCSTN